MRVASLRQVSIAVSLFMCRSSSASDPSHYVDDFACVFGTNTCISSHNPTYADTVELCTRLTIPFFFSSMQTESR